MLSALPADGSGSTNGVQMRLSSSDFLASGLLAQNMLMTAILLIAKRRLCSLVRIIRRLRPVFSAAKVTRGLNNLLCREDTMAEHSVAIGTSTKMEALGEFGTTTKVEA